MKSIQVYLRDDEFKKIKMEAQRANQSASAYIRQLLLNQGDEHGPPLSFARWVVLSSIKQANR